MLESIRNVATEPDRIVSIAELAHLVLRSMTGFLYPVEETEALLEVCVDDVESVVL